ncbi:hypothetical protein AJ88_11925 [Mesorhizobium amorphae CCBAU 01583]|nr:hypothetical protein AJ88_11925 [Mesorhizobium amorphae CCBAU 01583]
MHTALSFDAGAAGARLGPREAYKFAKGEEVISSTGQPARLSRPLDFLVVADHSDNMGWFTDFMAGKPEILQNAQAREWYDMIQSGQAGEAAWAIVMTFSQGKFPPDIIYQPGNPAYRSVWQSIISAAEEANDPGRFTAFIGYEWTSLSKGNNLHRNVIFRDGAKRPVSSSHTRRSRPSAATTRATCGNGCGTMRTRPAATCLPSPTMAI